MKKVAQSPTTQTTQSPGEQLANRILDRLRDEKLLLQDDLDRLRENLQRGSVRLSDWKRWIERSLYQEEQHGAEEN